MPSVTTRNAAVESTVDRIKAYYANAAKEIEKELKFASTARAFRIQAIRIRIQSILQELEKSTKGILAEEMEKHYLDGMQSVTAAMKKEGVENISLAFSSIDKEAVKVIADESQFYFAEAIRGVTRSTNQVLNQVQKLRIRAIIAEGKVTGEARREISGTIANFLSDQGITVLVDKSGKQWGMESYAEMLTRTASIKSSNEGIINRLAEDDYDLVQVSVHGAEDVCGDWEGKVLSASGKGSRYPSVAEAEADGLFHPNCKHRLLPYHPEIAKSA